MTKQEVLTHFNSIENIHCFDGYWTQQDILRIESKQIFCARCGNLLAQFNEFNVCWDLV
jgi:ribosomal protein S27AE